MVSQEFRRELSNKAFETVELLQEALGQALLPFSGRTLLASEGSPVSPGGWRPSMRCDINNPDRYYFQRLRRSTPPFGGWVPQWHQDGSNLARSTRAHSPEDMEDRLGTFLLGKYRGPYASAVQNAPKRKTGRSNQ
jgi:hypothetical protein